ncbi:hypothetical protein BH09GEM1_BH09GEM1_05300 [soil metagenome]
MRCGLLVVIASLCGPMARAQAGAPLSTADTISLERAAVRTALQPRRGTSPVCVISIADSLGAPIGRAFVDEGERIAHAMPTAGPGAASMSLTLIGIATGDTSMVRISLWGDSGANSNSFWENRFGYRFTRDRTGAEWHFVERVALYFADYVVTDTVAVAAKPTIHCLNAS